MATHKFKKTILSLKDGDTFTVPDGSGGTKVLKLTPERLKKWAGTFQQMKSAGINVPAPWRHQKEMTPVVMGHEGEGAVADAAQNAGFWTEMKYDPRAKALVGVVEVPGDRNDPNTPAGKMGTLVKETSIFTAPSWTDGRGRKWEDAIMHVGCVTYPIEPGQDNFELVEGEQVICMSFQEKPKKKPEEAPGGGTETDPAGETEVLDPESGTVSGDPEDVDKGLAEPESVPVGGGEIGNVIGMLESAGIVLPSSTTPNNFLAYLEIALGQFLACNEGEEEEMDGTYNTPPEGAKEKNAPVIMSFSDPQIKAILASKAVNPDTNKPFTEDELRGAVAPKIDDNVIMSHPLVTKLANTVDSVTSVLNEQARSGYRQRAGRLVNAKVIDQKYHDETLKPMIDAVVMSFQDGKPVQGPLDMLLTGLESAVKSAPFVSTSTNGFAEYIAMSHGVPQGAQTHDQLPGAPEESAEDVAARIKSWKSRGLL